MHPLVWIGAALGGLAFWRRKHLKEDAEKVTAVAKDATSRVTTVAQDAKDAASSRMAAARSGRKALLVELGEALYASRTDPGSDTDAEIDRLVAELEKLDAALDDGGEGVGGDDTEDAKAE